MIKKRSHKDSNRLAVGYRDYGRGDHMSTMYFFVCTRENMHPYNCGYDEGEEQGPPCRHCAGTKDDTHDPDQCFMCHCMDDEWLAAHEPKETP